jgi:hypothetical protein
MLQLMWVEFHDPTAIPSSQKAIRISPFLISQSSLLYHDAISCSPTAVSSKSRPHQHTSVHHSSIKLGDTSSTLIQTNKKPRQRFPTLDLLIRTSI